MELAHDPAIVRGVEPATGSLLGVVGADGEGHCDVPPASPGQLRLLRCAVDGHAHADHCEFLLAQAEPHLED
jgi:hypothetical protein